MKTIKLITIIGQLYNQCSLETATFLFLDMLRPPKPLSNLFCWSVIRWTALPVMIINQFIHAFLTYVTDREGGGWVKKENSPYAFFEDNLHVSK